MKKKRKNNTPWIAYWIGMAVVGVGIIGMVIFLIARKPAVDEVALAATKPQPEAAKPIIPRTTPADLPPKEVDVAQQPVEVPITPTEIQPKVREVPRPKQEEVPTEPTPEPKSTEPAVAGIEKGNQVLEVEGVDLQGKKFKISDYRGKVVLLDFWGFW